MYLGLFNYMKKYGQVKAERKVVLNDDGSRPPAALILTTSRL
jgi:hypothetical protein